MTFTPEGERLRRELLSPWKLWIYLWRQLPLAAVARLRIVSLDERGCEVCVPGGWRTQNPFRSTYFAAQFMGAEMCTGAPALVLARGAGASLSTLVQELHGRFTKKAVGPTWFRFDDVAGMARVVEAAAAADEGQTFTAHVSGRMSKGEAVSEFEVRWAFRRRR